jgi:hypothetical protein
MARIFSIQFNYEGRQHHAMVTVLTTPFFAEYNITMLDEAIAWQLPNNKIISTSKNSFTFCDSPQENSPELMFQILHAVVAHLQTVSA